MPYKKYVKTKVEINEDAIKYANALRPTFRAVSYDLKNLLEINSNETNKEDIQEKIKTISRIEVLLQEIRVN